MKRNIILQYLAIAVLALVVASGCAKKPAPEAAVTQEPVTQTEMPQEKEQGYPDGGMAEQQVTEEAPMAEAGPAGLERIFFDFDQYVLSSTARETLTENAAYLKANQRQKVQIEGHCDERGSDSYNLALGEKRALAARNFLVSLGIDQERLSIISYGEERPLDPAHDESAWAKNRRAEFVIK